jgi:hypothetical protein
MIRKAAKITKIVAVKIKILLFATKLLTNRIALACYKLEILIIT